MKLDETTRDHPPHEQGELDLSELRQAAVHEGPSSFNKSMDFARHTKRQAKRSSFSRPEPPSRDTSTDSDLFGMESFMGESFAMGDSFADASFAYSYPESDLESADVPSLLRNPVRRPDLETVLDLEKEEHPEQSNDSSKDLSNAEGEKTE